VTVHSIAQQRKKHDDGKCHHPDCGGRYFRVICPYKGQHPDPCPHEHVLPKRPYGSWHGELFGVTYNVAPPRCTDCGQNLYDEGAADA
jgi:hypothetical protein